ncbi:hypothetical protein BH09BAC1_BH09BAC1_26550 [soil metagenome]
MKTFTFKIESDKDAELLKQLLETAKFESKVEGFVAYDDDDFTEGELQVFRDREAEYRKNPSSATNAEELEAKLKVKYGF